MGAADGAAPRRGWLRSLGPALIVGSVVLGPGSILTASRVGHDFAYDLVWVVVGAALLMIGMTALAARLGATLDGTPCEELARRGGRPLAALVGVVLFGVIACFQFSNNIGVIAALEPLVGGGRAWPVALVVLLNLGTALALFGFHRLYRPIEKLMKVLVGLMALGFVGNLVLARPSAGAAALGLVPTIPEAAAGGLLPRRAAGGGIADPLLPVTALVGTTFSVAGAFYQSYLVRKKGWTTAHLRHGLVDSVVGIAVLGALSIVIMLTSAAVLHGRQGLELGSIADVARAIEPLFGPGAHVIFCVGLLAGAFSSFLVNVMIGGTVLSDGLGLGGDMDGRWPKVCTVVALATGMVVALVVQSSGEPPVRLILLAQALTVLGNPLLAGVMLWLSTRPEAGGGRRFPRWLQALAGAGFVVALALAVRVAIRLWLTAQ